MLPYFVLVGIPTIIWFLLRIKNYRTGNQNKIVIDIFFIIWLFLLIMRNESVGCDLYNYNSMFDLYQTYSFKQIFAYSLSGQFEFGYAFLSKIIGLFTNNFRVMIVISALISVIPLWIFYRNNSSEYSLLTILLFINVGLFPFYFSGLRQAMALSFIIPSFYYIKKKNLFTFLVYVFLGFLFHKSAICTLLIYPIYHLKIRNIKNLYFILPLLVVLFIFRIQIFTYIQSILKNYYNVIITNNGSIMMFLFLVCLMIFSFVICDNQTLDDETIGLRNILILCSLIQIFANINTLTMRINYYYLIFIPLLIPKIFSNSSIKLKNIAFIGQISLTLFLLAFYFYSAYTGADILNIYPYIFLE